MCFLASASQGMKDRLKGLEASLADKLAAAQRAGAILPAARSRADGMQSDDEDNASQGSPLKEGPSNLGVGGQEEEEEDARSDASPLPDDVIDAGWFLSTDKLMAWCQICRQYVAYTDLATADCLRSGKPCAV